MPVNPNLTQDKKLFIHLENVRIFIRTGPYCKMPIIVDEQNKIVKGTLDEQLFWSPKIIPLQASSGAIKRIVQSRLNLFQSFVDDAPSIKTKHIDEDSIYLCHTHGAYNYGHLHDSLQRLWNLPPSIIAESKRFIVSDTRRVKDFNKHLSALVEREVSDEDLIETRYVDVLSFRNLIYPRCPVYPASYTFETVGWIRQRYLSYFGIPDKTERLEPSIRLYLSRNHVRPGSRGVINESEILKVLQNAYGFIVLTGEEPLDVVIRLFNSAEIVIGPHGSLFANTIYCRSDCSIIEWCPANRVDYSFMRRPKPATDYNHRLVDADSFHNIFIDKHLIDEVGSLLESWIAKHC